MDLLLLYITVKTTPLRENDDLCWKTEKGQRKTLKTGHNIFSRSQFACGLGILVAPTFFPYSYKVYFMKVRCTYIWRGQGCVSKGTNVPELQRILRVDFDQFKVLASCLKNDVELSRNCEVETHHCCRPIYQSGLHYQTYRWMFGISKSI